MTTTDGIPEPTDGQVWVLHYWCRRVHHVSLHRDRAGAVTQLAAMVCQQWSRITDRKILDAHPEPPTIDQLAVNLYFFGLPAGDQEEYELRESTIHPRSATPQSEIEYVEGHVGEWICLCGNDPTDDGFDSCTIAGELVCPDEDGGWDVIHYRCMSCGRVIAQPTGQVVGRVPEQTRYQ